MLFRSLTSQGVPVLRLHYSADPGKDPRTMAGRVWLERAAGAYPGGMESSDWQKEMEIKYTAGSGGRVFPQWEYWQEQGFPIIIPSPVATEDARIWGSYDHGYANPCCYLVHATYPDGRRCTLWELYAPELEVHEIAAIIKGESVRTQDGREFDGNPYAGQESMKIADPEIDRRTQSASNSQKKRIIELFQLEGVNFVKGERGGDLTVLNWLRGTLWADPRHPQYQIADCCQGLIWELGRLTLKPMSPTMLKTRNASEELLDRDNHAWDALKYWMKRFPVGVRKPQEHDTTNSFEWWRQAALHPEKKRTFAVRYRRDMVT